MVGGKMFAAVCLDPNDRPYYINLKLEPLKGAFMRSQYEDVVPGYYSNKEHWNSVNPDGNLPDEVLMNLLDESYRLVLAGLPKRKQRETVGLTVCGTDCGTCGAFGNLCGGCNEEKGKVFHTDGKACPIYACSVQKKHCVSCAGCGELPCEIWKKTRDPQFSDEAFAANLQERMQRLQETWDK